MAAANVGDGGAGIEVRLHAFDAAGPGPIEGSADDTAIPRISWGLRWPCSKQDLIRRQAMVQYKTGSCSDQPGFSW